MSAKRKISKLTSSPGNSAKKKKPNTTASVIGGLAANESETLDSVPSPAPSAVESDGGGGQAGTKEHMFKDPSYSESRPVPSMKKGKGWRNLKQIVLTERSQPWPSDVTLYSSIDAPPSFKPAKKYSDLSGLPSTYRDPHTKLRYSSPDEYSRILLLPSDIVAGLLTLRKANQIVP